MRLGAPALIIVALNLVNFSSAESDYGEQGYYILGLRSIWQGFNRGFYKRSGKTAMSDNCIDEKTMNSYYNFVAIWNGAPTAQGDYVTSIGDLAHVIANVCDCNFR